MKFGPNKWSRPLGVSPTTLFSSGLGWGHGPEVASSLETYNTPYDQTFEDFLAQPAPEWEQTGLPRTVRQEMIRLDQMLEAYQVVGEDVDILADPT